MFDQAVLLALRGSGNPADSLGPRWLELTARDITSLGGYPVVILMTLCAIGFLMIAAKRHAAVLVLVSIGGGMLLSSGLKDLFERPRPDLVPHAVQVFTQSFPSGHATLSAVTYLTLGEEDDDATLYDQLLIIDRHGDWTMAPVPDKPAGSGGKASPEPDPNLDLIHRPE